MVIFIMGKSGSIFKCYNSICKNTVVGDPYKIANAYIDKKYFSISQIIFNVKTNSALVFYQKRTEYDIIKII